MPVILYWGLYMAISIDVRADVREATRYLNAVQRKAIPRATVRTLNKTGRTVTTQAAKSIKAETKLPAAFIKRKLEIRKANRHYFVWSIKALRATTNIIEWVSKGKQTTRAWRKKPGVKSKAWGGSKTYRGTFIGRGKNSSKLLVYKRDPSKPSGVTGVHGPSIRKTFIRTLTSLQRVALRRFGVVFKQEMSFELRRTR